MLVPSTFTGRYKNRMTSTAISTESMRSRSQARVVRMAEREFSRGLRSTRIETSPWSGTDSSMAGCLLLIYKEKSERAFAQARRSVGRTKMRFGWVRRRLVAYGASQFPFGAKPIFFGGTVQIAAADPIRMRQFRNLLVCD